MNAWAWPMVWVWDGPEASTGFYASLLGEAGETARVRVVTSGTSHDHVIGAVESVPAANVVRQD